MAGNKHFSDLDMKLIELVIHKKAIDPRYLTICYGLESDDSTADKLTSWTGKVFAFIAYHAFLYFVFK